MENNRYDFEYFEAGSSAAPQRKPEEKKKPPMKRVAPRTLEEKRQQAKAGLRKSLRVFAFVLAMFMIVSIQIAAIARDYWLDREIQKVQGLIAVEESENVRLSSTLNGITSIAAIETYATEVLGMTKAESYQIECIDLSVGDAVLFTSSLMGKH